MIDVDSPVGGSKISGGGGGGGGGGKKQRVRFCERILGVCGDGGGGSRRSSRRRRRVTIRKRIDLFARVAVPLTIVTFNVYYWGAAIDCSGGIVV